MLVSVGEWHASRCTATPGPCSFSPTPRPARSCQCAIITNRVNGFTISKRPEICRSMPSPGCKTRFPGRSVGVFSTATGSQDMSLYEEYGWWESPSDQGPAAIAAQRMVEWPQLCNFVAGFAQTSKGRQDILDMQPPTSQDRTEILAAETHAADVLESEYAVQLNFGGINTLEANQALLRASRGGMLLGDQLRAVAQTVTVGLRLKRQIQTACRNEEMSNSELRPVLVVVSSLEPNEDVGNAIGSCIDEKGHVRASASPELESSRHRLLSLEGRVKGILKGYPGEVIQQGGRWCVALSDPNTIPPRALIVGTSSGGSVSYVEPQAAVPINNEISLAESNVRSAEEAILWRLTKDVEDSLYNLESTLNAVCWLDAITAKARFGNWIGGEMAEFLPFPKSGKPHSKAAKLHLESEPQWLIHLRRLQHPLLLAEYLKKQGKHKDGTRTSKAVSNARDRLLRKSAMAKNGSAAASRNRAGDVEDATVRPVSSDLCIQQGTRALIITGPNTGGKTITLKALGLCVLMARCGIPIPAAYPAQLPCFNAVLADIGDEQSLSASLSTFSGHLKRIQDLRAESDSKSLVLLDEVGTGTDPAEGTALGIALLRTLVRGGPGGAAFTMATTHMGALTSLKYSDGVFENASVEFNEEELKPTYRLLMGVPGRSNALNIAARLGLDREVVETAKAQMGTNRLDVEKAITQLESMHQQAAADDEECKTVDVAMSRVAIDYRKIKKQLDEAEATLDIKRAEAINSMVRNANSSLSSNESRFQKQQLEKQKRTSVESKKAASLHGFATDLRLPEVGDIVFVPKLQKRASVLKVKNGKKPQVDLKVGALTITAKVDEVELVQ